MRLPSTLLVSSVLGLLGCGDAPPGADPYQCTSAGGGGCFELPTDVIGAADASGTAVLPVLDCGPFEETTGAVALAGRTVDFADRLQAVVGVRVEGFADLAMTERLFDVTSDADGTYTANVGAMPSTSFLRTTMPGAIGVEWLYRRNNVAEGALTLDVSTATRAEVDAVLHTVGDRVLDVPARTQVFADARDCAGNRLTNVIANIAPTSARNGSRLFEPGVRIYYADDAGTLRRRTEQMQTAASGSLLATNLSVGTHYVQLWGFPDEASLVQDTFGLVLLTEMVFYVPDSESAQFVTLYGHL